MYKLNDLSGKAREWESAGGSGLDKLHLSCQSGDHLGLVVAQMFASEFRRDLCAPLAHNGSIIDLIASGSLGRPDIE